MIKVISFKICPFVQRVTAYLAAKKIPFEVEYISLKDKPQWFLDISPNGQVPVLISETGTPLFESDAIIEFLVEVYGPLEEELSPEQKAIDRAWSYMAVKNYLSQCSTMRSKDENSFEENAAKLKKIFEKAESQISSGPYFKGKQISQVDIAWLPLLHRADIINKHTGFDFFAGLDKVQEWQRSIMAADVVNQSVAEDFEGSFTNFYLSDETYLGSGLDNSLENDSCCAVSCCQ